MSSNRVTVVLIVLIILVFSSLFILWVTIQFPSTSLPSFSSLLKTTKEQSLVNNQKTRGYLEEGTDATIYQFPVQILSEVTLQHGLYSVNASPFGSLTEEFPLNLGLESQSIPFGTCSFTESGLISGSASWSLTPLKEIQSALNIGDSILVRLTYPTEPVNDQIQYVEELIKRIDMIERQEPLDYLFPYSLCINSQS